MAALSRRVGERITELRSCGVGRGSLVGVATPHALDFLATSAAIRELEALPVMLPGLDDVAVAEEWAARLALPAMVCDRQSAFASRGRKHPDMAPPADVAVICVTSGSTGHPRAVMLSRAGLDYQARETIARLQLTREDVLLLMVPLWHSYGLSVVEIWTRLGATLVLEDRYSPHLLVERVAGTQATSVDAVPSMYGALVRFLKGRPELAAGLSGVHAYCGGDRLPPALFDSFLELTGRPLLDGYGLTEAGPNVAISGPSCWRRGTVGPPLSGTELQIDAGSGELLVRSPSLSPGYWQPWKPPAEQLKPGGWLRTGDLAELEADGYLRVTGRLKNVAIVHGHTLHLEDVEDVLRQAPDVDQVVAIAFPEGERGDRLCAAIRPAKATEHVDAAALRRQLHAALGPAAVLWRILETQTIPRLASGKPDRKLLLDAFAGQGSEALRPSGV